MEIETETLTRSAVFDFGFNRGGHGSSVAFGSTIQ